MTTSTLFFFACTQATNDEGPAKTSQTLQGAGVACAGIDPARSLFVTNPTELANFSLEAVLNQIVATGGGSGQTALGLYQQMLDTLNDAAHAHGQGSHCDDHRVNGLPAINGFPIECPRQEGTLASTNPFGTDDNGYTPIGLVNRFDLAPQDGSSCGQYRVVFGKNSGKAQIFDRMLLIFEAVMPNPNPSAGIAGCRAVPQFWADLSSDDDASSRASRLQDFYFKGLPGFEPVVAAAHYGIGGGTDTGQIRANMFMNAVGGQNWQLREFRLTHAVDATTSVTSLVAQNTFVQVNPFGGLFTADGDSNAFQSAFLNQVGPLASNDLNTIGMTTDAVHNAGQSDEQNQSNDYANQAQNNAALHKAITDKLAQIGRPDLTSTNVVERATTQSCAGCHQISPGRSLGGGLTWPASNGFTQITENGTLSPALTGTFLPFRAQVLGSFLGIDCGDAGTPPPVDAGSNDAGSTPDDAGPIQGDGGGGPIQIDAGPGTGGSVPRPHSGPAVRRTVGGGIVGTAN
ncbi:MAG TPA: hypothetical protein VNO21_14190 [Polyangiaceae bacterium]|nr:hypothetical protein [Polyangiaceae bacterium]